MTERFVAIGDPQAPSAHVLAVVKRAKRAGIVVVGDYFDYPSDDRVEAGRDCLRTLRALAELPAERAILLMGNHDACRVMELARTTDERFARARDHGEVLPELPNAGMATRDFQTFLEAQRVLVMELLLARRLRLAAVARIKGSPEREVLVTHAAVTTRETRLLDPSGRLADETRAASLAEALNAFLDRAVDDVRDAWERGDCVPLDLSPVHVAGVSGQEGGGLLYHRPANPARDTSRHGVDVTWEQDPRWPRRFNPRTLPRGLVQVCGHTTHKKSWKELAGWAAPGVTKADVAIRTLIVPASGEPTYHTAKVAIPEDAAALVMVDAAMRNLAPGAVPLLKLEDARTP